ncbi:MAG: SAM-dependent chlorinase/fluorinase [Elusimicrobia bacterium]|nr:SAM-dependent chlorinase/fluorinase [Elusimicrobiota bacterium]
MLRSKTSALRFVIPAEAGIQKTDKRGSDNGFLRCDGEREGPEKSRLRSIIRPHIAFLVLLSISCAKTPVARDVVFLTDFGTKDDSVAICKAVMWSVNPRLKIVDLTHEVAPYDINSAGRLVAGTASYYPPGTVFAAVVDPGVGSRRQALAIATRKGHFYVGPDNGLFTRVIEEEGLEEARLLTNSQYFYKTGSSQKLSHTFHGRDIFSPVAAHLASGLALGELGPKTTSIILLPFTPARTNQNTAFGQIEFVEEPYGNVITNITSGLLDRLGLTIGSSIRITWKGKSLDLPLVATFSGVAQGKPLALISSRGYLCLAINMGNFAKTYSLGADAQINVSLAD